MAPGRLQARHAGLAAGGFDSLPPPPILYQEVSMDFSDIILNPALPLGSAVWDSNGTVHWAVGERAVLNNR